MVICEMHQTIKVTV